MKPAAMRCKSAVYRSYSWLFRQLPCTWSQGLCIRQHTLDALLLACSTILELAKVMQRNTIAWCRQQTLMYAGHQQLNAFAAVHGWIRTWSHTKSHSLMMLAWHIHSRHAAAAQLCVVLLILTRCRLKDPEQHGCMSS